MEKNKFRNLAFKQYNIGAWIGGAVSLYGATSIYQAVINSFLLAVTAYHTTLRDTIQVGLPWMTFPMFFASLLILYLCLMVLHYKFVMPSIVAFANLQAYKHESPVRRDLAEILKRLEKIENTLKNDENVKNT